MIELLRVSVLKVFLCSVDSSWCCVSVCSVCMVIVVCVLVWVLLCSGSVG